MSRPGSILGLALVSAGALAFEIGLTRLFAIQQFHHFAFIVVSLATMGSAASGLLLAARARPPSLSILSAAFGLSVLVAYGVINLLPFDSYTLAWDPRQIAILIVYFLSAGLPFVLAGWVAGACLAAAGPAAHRPYAANLIGAAAGTLGALLGLEVLPAEGLVFLAGAMGLLAASAFSEARLLRSGVGMLALACLALAARLPASWSLRLSPYKPLAVTMLVPDARLTLTRSGASGRVDVLESHSIHVFPGLSLNAGPDLPLQAALFVDGDGPLPLVSLSPNDPQAATVAAHMPASLAYRLRPQAATLILDPGAGLEAWQALASGAEQVTLPTDDPLIAQILAGPYAAFSQGLVQQPNVRLLPASSRATLQSSHDRYDIVHFALSDSYHPVTSGAFSLNEDYALTVEALRQAYRHLADNGLLMITRWLQTPPSEEARVFATLLEAMEQEGVSQPLTRVLAFRTLRTATILASRQPFSAQELSTVRSFLEANAFDPIVLPDLLPEELNRHNRLPVDRYHSLFASLLANRRATLEGYSFNLQPPTDNRPYFFHFFRWRQTPDLLRSLGLTWQPFGGSGYLVLLALLALMVVLALPFGLLPLSLLRRRHGATPRGVPLAYFACLGAGYLLVEISLLQRMTLLLDRPSLSLGVVLFTLLLASGVGSLLSARWPLRRALAALVATLAATAILLPPILAPSLAWPLAIRIPAAMALLAPAGLLMGIPFAAGLRRLEIHSPGLIPWAWAVNGAVSGVSGVLAALISLDAGHSATLMIGALAYAGAWLAAGRMEGR